MTDKQAGTLPGLWGWHLIWTPDVPGEQSSPRGTALLLFYDWKARLAVLCFLALFKKQKAWFGVIEITWYTKVMYDFKCYGEIIRKEADLIRKMVHSCQLRTKWPHTIICKWKVVCLKSIKQRENKAVPLCVCPDTILAAPQIPHQPLPPYQQTEQEIGNEERIFNRMFLIFSIDSRDVLLVGSLK